MPIKKTSKLHVSVLLAILLHAAISAALFYWYKPLASAVPNAYRSIKMQNYKMCKRNECVRIHIYLSIYLFVYFIRRYIHACMHAQTHTYTQYIYTCIPCFHNSGVYIHGIYSPIAILLPYQVDQYKKICAYICLNKHIYMCVP